MKLYRIKKSFVKNSFFDAKIFLLSSVASAQFFHHVPFGCYVRLNIIYFENIKLFEGVLSISPVYCETVFSVGLFSRCLQMGKQKQNNFHFTKKQQHHQLKQKVVFIRKEVTVVKSLCHKRQGISHVFTAS